MPFPLLRFIVALCSALAFFPASLQTGVAAAGARAPRNASIPANMRVSNDKYLAHSEPALAENPRNHSNLLAGSKMFTDPAHYEFKVGTYYSTDGGRTWHDSGFLPGFEGYAIVSDVSIAFSSDGVAYVAVLAWDGHSTSGIYVSRSTDGGKTFSAPVEVFKNTSGSVFNDKPWIAVDQSKGPNRGTVYVAWNIDGAGLDRTDPDSPAGDGLLRPHAEKDYGYGGIAVARSTDGGATYSQPVIVAPFDQAHFDIGATPAVGPDGRLFVVFLSYDATGMVDGMAMVSSSDGGNTFSDVRIVQDDVVGVPNHLPHSTFRNNSMPSFAVSPKDGSMVIVWSDYRYHDADIMASTSKDGGRTWSGSARVNSDKIKNGKDQFLPALAVAPNGVYTCAWFDRSYDPKGRLIDEAAAQSSNDGRSFGATIRVTKQSWNPAINAPRPEGKATNTFIGDYQALAADNHTVHPLWNDTQNGKSQEIRTATMGVQLFRR